MVLWGVRFEDNVKFDLFKKWKMLVQLLSRLHLITSMTKLCFYEFEKRKWTAWKTKFFQPPTPTTYCNAKASKPIYTPWNETAMTIKTFSKEVINLLYCNCIKLHWYSQTVVINAKIVPKDFGSKGLFP